MTVNELIEALNTIENKDLKVKCPQDETCLGTVEGINYRGGFIELTVGRK